MLQISNLSVSAGGKQILNDVSLVLRPGQTAVLIGPNGCGKSTLLQTIVGMGHYVIESGDILINNHSIIGMDIEERIKMGLGIMIQLPPVIDGVTLDAVVQQIRQHRGKETADSEIYISETIKSLKDRNLNKDFSGGEIKQSELFQLLHLEPTIALLDEPESGVDLESINHLGQQLKMFLEADPQRCCLIITHSGKIIDYIGDCEAFLMHNGRIIKHDSSAIKLLRNIEQTGFLEQAEKH